MSNQSKLRVGIVGAGIRGTLYARALRRVPNVEVIGLCDLSEPVARAAEERLALPVGASHQELLAGEPDAVIVATPDFAHVAPAVDAAAAGCHLMIEKPLATTVEDAQAIADAVAAAGRQCLVAFENRWNPAFAQLHDRVAAGEMGRLVSQTAVLSTTRWVPTEMLGWAGKSSPLWFLMPHTLDLAMWLANSRPVRVSAMGHRGLLEEQGIDTWDVVHGIVELADGSLVNLEASWVLPDALPSVVDFRYQLAGTDGAAYVDQFDQGLLVAADGVSLPRNLVTEVRGEPQGFPVWMVTEWAVSLLAGIPLGPTAADGLDVTRALEALDQSLVSGMPVTLETA